MEYEDLHEGMWIESRCDVIRPTTVEDDHIIIGEHTRYPREEVENWVADYEPLAEAEL